MDISSAVAALIYWGELSGLGVKDLIPFISYMKKYALVVRMKNYNKRYRIGVFQLKEERPKITEILYKYYKHDNSNNDGYLLSYRTNAETRYLPLITKLNYVPNENNFNINITCGQFTGKQIIVKIGDINGLFKKTRMTEIGNKQIDLKKFVREISHWEAANLKIWNDKLYSLQNVIYSNNNNSHDIKLNFCETDFYTYRATYGSINDELAMFVYKKQHLKFLSYKKLRAHLPKREFFLNSINEIFSFSNRICAGGPIVLFAINRGNDNIGVIIQKRSVYVSDEPGAITVIPKAFHQPYIDPYEDFDLESTIWRECYEELFGGEDLLRNKRHISNDFYLSKKEALRDLHGRYELKPLGVFWDLFRGNYHVAYCLFVHDPAWWEKYSRDICVNWEVDQELKGFLKLDSGNQHSLIHLVGRHDWAPESYFTFIEGLRWLSTKVSTCGFISKLLPALYTEQV
ncbi:MAG: hypothetical protein MUO63_21085 [Desulfobulbaceae bacterium]|nr:hypothetical protein [Desulfobulbaceae bacterium]